MTDLPRKVVVNFLVPGVGPTKEEYDCFCSDDIATWQANNKLSLAIQTSVTTIETVEGTPENIARMKRAQKAGKEKFEKIRRAKE